MKKKVIIKFKDGYEVPIICENFTVTKYKNTGELSKVSWEGAQNINLLHFDLADVKMIYQDMTYEEIKPLPVKWIKDEFGSRCDACGRYAYMDKFGKPWESDFCPNCGARMEVNAE